MEQSEHINELAVALMNFTLKMKTVSFDSNNPFFKSKYASLTTLVESSRSELSNCGLAVSQLTEDEGSVTTILMHESGQWIRSKLTLKPKDDTPQGRGSCITYARRYSYASILGLVSDDDDDGNAATHVKKAETKEPEPLTNKDRIMNMGITKFKTADAFKAWRVDNNLKEDLTTATETDLNFIMAVLREAKGK